MSFRYALATDVGQVREHNEDSARVVDELDLFIVADGMGGHVAGEVASRVAADSLAEAVASSGRPRRVRDDHGIMTRAIHAANAAVLRESETRNLYGMGTTLTALRIRQRTATVAHVGDTRAYYVRENGLERLTTDHTFVTMLLASGAIEESDADSHPDRHLLTQAIGTQLDIEPDVFQKRLPRRGRILLSSDGLHDLVPAERIHELARLPGLDTAVHALVDAANAEGSPDNVTAILVDPNPESSS